MTHGDHGRGSNPAAQGVIFGNRPGRGGDAQFVHDHYHVGDTTTPSYHDLSADTDMLVDNGASSADHYYHQQESGSALGASVGSSGSRPLFLIMIITRPRTLKIIIMPMTPSTTWIIKLKMMAMPLLRTNGFKTLTFG
ncbi:hypothetical protein ACA910_002710 [Epithemia clementina (nom. ined.)]